MPAALADVVGAANQPLTLNNINNVRATTVVPLGSFLALITASSVYLFVISVVSLSLPQPPLAQKLDERGFHLPAVQTYSNNVEVGLAGQPPNLFLPVGHSRRK